MTWHGPRGSCGCCKPCRCPDGDNLSRQFLIRPTAKVTIANLPATYSFEFGYVISTTAYHEVVTLDGLDCLNGTYFFSYAINSSTGCVNWTIPLTAASSCSFDEISTFNTLSGSSGCYVASSSTNTFSVSINLNVAYFDRGFGRSGWQATVGAAGLNPAWRLGGVSVAECRFGYDPSLTTHTFSAGVSPFGSTTKNAADQKIWLSWRPSTSDRCTPIAPLQTVDIGDVTIEIVDL
jgi:hypothetical protein